MSETAPQKPLEPVLHGFLLRYPSSSHLQK